MHNPTDETKPIGIAGWSLIAMFGFSFAVILAAIWQWLRGLYGPALDTAAVVCGLVTLALVIGFLAGQESKGK